MKAATDIVRHVAAIRGELREPTTPRRKLPAVLARVEQRLDLIEGAVARLTTPKPDPKLEARALALAEAREDLDSYRQTMERLGAILHEIASVIHGPAPEGMDWSFHDLPDLVRALVEENARLKRGDDIRRSLDGLIAETAGRLAELNYYISRLNDRLDTRSDTRSDSFQATIDRVLSKMPDGGPDTIP